MELQAKDRDLQWRRTVDILCSTEEQTDKTNIYIYNSFAGYIIYRKGDQRALFRLELNDHLTESISLVISFNNDHSLAILILTTNFEG